MDQRPPAREFGQRRPASCTPPVKRSSHVALLLMGTLAVAGGAYALMPRERCQPNSPGAAAPALPESADCGRSGSRGSGGSSGGSHGGSSYFSSSGDSSGRSASAGASESSSGGVTRGGFGSFGHGFGGSGGE
jgi:hypothetical protein